MYRYRTIFEIYTDQIRDYIHTHAGIMDQVKYVEENPGVYSNLSLEDLDKFLVDLKGTQVGKWLEEFDNWYSMQSDEVKKEFDDAMVAESKKRYGRILS